MNDSELYKELGVLTKNKDKWEENIPYVSSLLSHESEKIKAKALWLLGEMGLLYPQKVKDAVPEIVSFCESPSALLRERALNALGRIGRTISLLIRRMFIKIICRSLKSFCTIQRIRLEWKRQKSSGFLANENQSL